MKNVENTLYDGTKVEIKELTPKDLANLLNLQDKIINNLKEDEQHFILKRTAEDFLKAIDSDHSFVIGMYDLEKNKLIGQSILSLPNDNEDRELSEYCSEYKNSEIAVFKAVIADPDYRGNGIMKKMLKIREEIAKEHGRKIAISQIAADNPSSWINALRNGMKVTKVGFDPEDSAKVVYLKKGLQSQEIIKYNKEDRYDLLLSGDVHKSANILFNKMMKLSENDYVGIDWDRENHTLSWYKSKNQVRSYQQSNILCDKFER